MKRCCACKKSLPLTSFWKKGARLHSRCVDCSKLYQHEWYRKPENRTRTIARTKKDRLNYRKGGEIAWIKMLLRQTANRTGLPLSSDVQSKLAKKLSKIPARCPYTGVKLVPGINLTLDHIYPVSRYPDRTWKVSNIEWVSRQYNMAKGNMTVAEFTRFCKKVLLKLSAA